MRSRDRLPDLVVVARRAPSRTSRRAFECTRCARRGGASPSRSRCASSGAGGACMARGDATIDGYLSYLRDVRRMSPNTIESYARDLVALAAFAEKKGQPVEALTLRDLEAFARQLMSAGLSPRSVARAIACIARVLPVPAARAADRRRSRRRSARAARVAGAAEVSRPRGGRSAARAARPDDAARPARQGADRTALRHRPAGHRAAVAQGQETSTSTRAT